MSSATATSSSPSSLQLRLALCRGGSREPSRAFLVKARVRKLGRLFPRLSIGQSESPRDLGSWTGSDNGADALSGWSGSDDAQGSLDSRRKKWFGGIVGAGVILAAGITFAAIFAGKRSTLGLKPEMVPLTTQQEALLAPDDQHVELESNKKEGTHARHENVNLSGVSGVGVLLEDDAVAAPANIEARGSLNDAAPESAFRQKGDLINNNSTGESLTNFTADYKEDEPSKTSSSSVLYESTKLYHTQSESMKLNDSIGSHVDTSLEPKAVPNHELLKLVPISAEENHDADKAPQVSFEGINSALEEHDLNERVSSATETGASSVYAFAIGQEKDGQGATDESATDFATSNSRDTLSYAGIPAPSFVSEALQVSPGKTLVPPTVDQVQGQALAALQALKVIEVDVQAGDICTRREYARWLVSASSALSRDTISKVYPAMYIENVTELAFDDITPEDPDFVSIQGLAEAGLISSKLSRRDMMSSPNETEEPLYFFPEIPLSRQDLVSWKMALEKKQLPEANKEGLRRVSGFIDIDKINPDAYPALVADLSAGEQGIIALAFGYTKLFQPDKPVTKAQAAIALTTGEAADTVSEELARIEAEAMAENAVAAHSALVAQVEKDINASFEKVLSAEREKIHAVEKKAEEARLELEKLRAKRGEDSILLMKERAAVESEMVVLSRLRREVEEQLESLMSNKIQVSYEKGKIEKLRLEAEKENQEIARLQYDLEVERKALAMARAWAEDEAKRAREHARVLEEARYRWERQGIKVVVDSDLQEETSAGLTWINAGKELSVDETVNRAETLVDKLKDMAAKVGDKSRDLINKIVQIILVFVSNLKRWSSNAMGTAGELRCVAVTKVGISAEELQQSIVNMSLDLKEGAKRFAGDCKEGVEKLTQKFKT
ncbi:uncharacterized protein LOC115742673 isoform X2 [Rhodamnia argentea]|uniref:Uncharacterized protein LOC115742673 isoform X2 n=1 Tax=Rhodamnia argentea TaxID=178133 RepID=A0A8B8PEJ7_9MYRT|nr:uncharacterized protein LOC115742673 isoform X2 [Rhodamnia argentea]